MRASFILLLSGVLLVGCKHPQPSDAAKTGDVPVKKRAEKSARGTPDREPATQGQRATAVTETAGKVASVNPNLRFVVIDFAFNPAPPVDRRMSIYRQGQKVGEVKISAQSRNSIIAADITAGEAQVGDEVRPD